VPFFYPEIDGDWTTIEAKNSKNINKINSLYFSSIDREYPCRVFEKHTIHV